MKKITSFLLVLLIAMVVKAQTTTTYDFEDGVALFTADSRITTAVESELGYDGSKAVSFTCSHNAQNGYSFAHYDFTSLVGNPKIIAFSFQYYNTDGGRAILSIGDASVRGTTGNSSKGTYSNQGAIFALGSNKNYALINGISKSKSSFCNKWLNVSVTVNVIDKTYSYSIKESATETELASEENIAYYSSDALTCTQIDLFGYINNSKCAYIDNLRITVTPDERSYADYTVAYVDESGNTLKESATYKNLVGGAITLTESDMASFKNSDNTKKYIYKSDDAADHIIASDGSTVVTVTFREAETYSYTVNAVDGESNVLETIISGSYFEDETITAYCGVYIFKESILYEKSNKSNYGCESFTLSADNITINVDYSVSSLTNPVYFSEAENIDGLTKHEDGYTRGRMSKGAAGYASELTTITTLPAGVYTLTSATRSGITKFYAASDSVFTIESTGFTATGTSGEFTLYEPTEIKVSAGDKDDYFDYLLILRTGDAPELVIDDNSVECADFAPEYEIYAKITYNRDFTADYYYLMVLPFAPDETSLQNYSFYKLSSVADDAVTFAEETAPVANTPYLCCLKEGATTTNSITGGPTTVSTEVNYETVGTWTLVGSLKNETVNSTSSDNYLLHPINKTLHKVTSSLTVYPYTAYLQKSLTGIEVAPATMRLFISGPTGIKEISVDRVEGFGTGCFDLQGRPISKPMKGQIYIKDGKKIIH